jgi:hypothetical protein
MMRRAVVFVVLLLAGGMAIGDPLPATPFTQDPLGPIADVTASWQDYQPRDAFCVYPDSVQYPGPAEAAVSTGADADCAASGFAPAEAGLVKITVGAPPLCEGCRRLFINYSMIPANALPNVYAHGHVYLHLASLNPSSTVHPEAHSPNIKNFTNDKLFVPDDAAYQPVVHEVDTHDRAYTGNTVHFVHNKVQGPYYVGPWYVNRDGMRVPGAYLDVTIDPSSAAPPEVHQVNEIGYIAGFHSGEEICFDEIVGDPYRDGDAYYGGCIDGFGAGRTPVDPGT